MADESDRTIDVGVAQDATEGSDRPRTVRVAAAGDVHCDEGSGPAITRAIDALEGAADILLLAGDLTTHGEPAQVRPLAEACRDRPFPVVAVLGNHDWHVNRGDEVAGVLTEAGVEMLDRTHAVCSADGVSIGIAGTKGFVGGFGRGNLPDFGEPSLRALYTETGDEVRALDDGLRAIATCPIRIVLLHYAPIADTLEGEPREIWTMLGSDRLSAPLVEHQPDLVLHGHAHGGRFAATLGEIPVHNVSVPVMGRDFWIFELQGVDRAVPPLH